MTQKTHILRPIPLGLWSHSKETHTQYQTLCILTYTMLLKHVIDFVAGLCYCYVVFSHAHSLYQYCHIFGTYIQYTVLSILEVINHTPMGLKFNTVATRCMSDIIMLCIHSSGNTLMNGIHQDIGVWLVRIVGLLGVLGISTPLVFIIDIIRILTYHIKIVYGAIAMVTYYQYQLLITLFYLFQNKKKNILRRDRIDTCVYDSEQLMYGTVLFVMLCFLFPSCVGLYMIFLCFQLLISVVCVCVWVGYDLVMEAPYYILYCYIVSMWFSNSNSNTHTSNTTSTSNTSNSNSSNNSNMGVMDGELLFIDYHVTTDQSNTHTHNTDKSVKHTHNTHNTHTHTQGKYAHKPSQYISASLCYKAVTFKSIWLKYFRKGLILGQGSGSGSGLGSGTGSFSGLEGPSWGEVWSVYILPCLWGLDTNNNNNTNNTTRSSANASVSAHTFPSQFHIPSVDYFLLNIGSLLNKSRRTGTGTEAGTGTGIMCLNHQYIYDFIINYRHQLPCMPSMSTTHATKLKTKYACIDIDINSMKLKVKANRYRNKYNTGTDKDKAKELRYNTHIYTIYTQYIKHLIRVECFHILVLIILSISLMALLVVPFFIGIVIYINK